jgi:HSP20 family protein
MSTLLKTNTGRIKPATLSNFFDPYFKRDWADIFGKDMVDTIPAANIAETNGSYMVELAAPGLKKEDFKIKVDGDMITISSEKETETKSEEKDYSRREYNYTSFSRSFQLPESIDQEKIKATYADGLLRVDLPKKTVSESQSARKITVS